MRKKFRFINDGDYYTAFENNSIIEIELKEEKKFDRERNYIGYGISKNTGCDTFQLVRGESLFPLENKVKRL